MSNPTTPFSWQMPTNTDLVTDLPADFEVFGQAVATSMQDLLGGTTGQVLAKASNTDMDFVWSADAAGMTNPMTTTGDVIYSSPGSTPVRLGIGSTGNVLTVAGGIPTWAAPAAGGMTLISTTTLTGSSIVLSSIPSTYKNLQLVIRNFKPATDGQAIRLRINADTALRYNIAKTNSANNAGTTTTFNDDNVIIQENNDNSVDYGLSVTNVYDYANATTYKMIDFRSVAVDPTTTTSIKLSNGFAYYNQTAAITGLTIYVDSGTYTSGTALLYGVK